jgi:hypothetical protein
MVTLPLALESPRGLALAFRRGRPRGLDRIGGRAELVGGDVCNDPGLPSGVRGMSRCPTEVSGRTHCMATGSPSLHHRDLATRPGAGMLDRLPHLPSRREILARLAAALASDGALLVEEWGEFGPARLLTATDADASELVQRYGRALLEADREAGVDPCWQEPS